MTRTDTEPDGSLPDGLDVATLPRLSIEQMCSYGYECVSLERGLYQGPRGDYYRSPYHRPD